MTLFYGANGFITTIHRSYLWDWTCWRC